MCTSTAASVDALAAGPQTAAGETPATAGAQCASDSSTAASTRAHVHSAGHSRARFRLRRRAACRARMAWRWRRCSPDPAQFSRRCAAAELYAADVYCGAPTGGAVDAVAAAFGWLAREQVAVINVSLVGPRNALLERVVASLVKRGHVIVAAVGNEGPAAPPLYPAAYDGVVGVTAVDARASGAARSLSRQTRGFRGAGRRLSAAHAGAGCNARPCAVRRSPRPSSRCCWRANWRSRMRAQRERAVGSSRAGARPRPRRTGRDLWRRRRSARSPECSAIRQ